MVAVAEKLALHATEELCFLHGLSDTIMRNGVFFAVHAEKSYTESVIGLIECCREIKSKISVGLTIREYGREDPLR
jgi:hypothetical protein